MEEREKHHILQNLSELINKTSWRTSCVTIPIENGIFGDDDVAILESIPNERKRILEFYQLFMKKHNSYQHLITTMEKGCQSGVVEILNGLDEKGDPSPFELESCSSSSIGIDKNLSKTNGLVAGRSGEKISTCIRFDILQPVRHFTGRIKELENLHKKLQQSNSNPTVISQMVSIVGLGGIGKTELARKYIQEYAKDYDNNILWISAETEESLAESFGRLATDYLKLNHLNGDGKEKLITTVIDEVYKFFEGRQSLFVFDNGESNDILQKFLPIRVQTPPYVLITSRDKEWLLTVEILELNEMEENESIEFVKNGLQIQDDNEDEIITNLVKKLQCFPLALSQALSYIKQKQMIRNYSICEYLEEYKSCSEKLLNCNIPSVTINNYTKTTFTTWKLTTELISLDKDCGKVAIQMLNIISYFQPDKIPTKILLIKNTNEISWLSKVFRGFNQGWRESQLDSSEINEKALHFLVKYSMINIQPKEQTISIHRLVQEVTRIELRRQNLEEKILRNALKIVAQTHDFNSLLQLLSVFKYCEIYKKHIFDFKSVPWRMLHSLTKLDGNCDPVSTSRIAAELKEILHKCVPSNDPDLIRLEGQVAISNYRLGNFSLAIKSFEVILPIYLENKLNYKFSKNEILNVQYFYALCLRRLGKQIESLKILFKIWEEGKILHGLNYWWTIEVLVNVGNCLAELGYFKEPSSKEEEYLRDLNLGPNFRIEIVTLLKEAYETNKCFISTDEKYSSTIFSIPHFFLKVGDNDTAREIAKYIYEQGKNCDNRRIQTFSIRSLNLLGVLKGKEGKQEEAYEIFKQVQNLNSKMEQENCHVHTLIFKTNVLNRLADNGQYESALEGYREVLEKFKKSYPNRPELCRTEYSIGAILFNLKRYEESLALLLDLQERLEERFGQTGILWLDVNNLVEKIESKKIAETCD